MFLESVAAVRLWTTGSPETAGETVVQQGDTYTLWVQRAVLMQVERPLG